jgi:hypothetical protein
MSNMKKVKVTIETTVTDQYYTDMMVKAKASMDSGEFQLEMLENVGIEECTASFEELKQD